MRAPVALVHVLQHALAVPVREIDIDVGGFLSLFGEKPFEEQLHANGIDGGDAKAVADRGVGGRAAPLTENAFSAREAHNVPDDEKEPSHLELGDHAQFMRQLRALLGAILGAPALMRALIDEAREVFIGRNAMRQWERRHGGFELMQPECALLGDGQRGAHALFGPVPSFENQGRCLEGPLGVGAQSRAHLVQRALMAQGTQHVVDDAPLGTRIVHVVGNHPRDPQTCGQRTQTPHEHALFGETMIPAFDREMIAEEFA